MFKKKQIENLEDEIVKCNECKNLLYKKDSQIVNKEFIDWGISTEEDYYCRIHVKPYDRYVIKFGRVTFYKEMEVDEKGCPIGYIKKIK